VTTINLNTREDWNARPPEKVTPLDWSRVTQFVVHISGAVRTQSVRSIQDYCMDNKGHSDIDYNELVRGGDLYVGRGGNVGSHTLEQNSISYGVCIIGMPNDATPDDFNVVRSRYDWACQVAGRQLKKLGHRTAIPNHTDCPGDKVQAWIDAGMPYFRRKIDMFFLQVDGDPAVYVSDGLRTRSMPAGTWDNTCIPLINAGVPHLLYKTSDELFRAGGPLDDRDTFPPINLPSSAKLTFPDGTITFE